MSGMLPGDRLAAARPRDDRSLTAAGGSVVPGGVGVTHPTDHQGDPATAPQAVAANLAGSRLTTIASGAGRPTHLLSVTNRRGNLNPRTTQTRESRSTGMLR